MLLTIYQMTQHRPQRFEPPPSSTSAEIGTDAPPPAEAPAEVRQPARFTPPTPKETTTAEPEPEPAPSYASAPDLSGLDEPSGPPTPVDTSLVYTYVEQMPQPPGGHEGLLRYLAKNLKLSAAARREAPTGGHVFVQFIVRPNGRLTDFRVTKGIGPAVDAEAVRVLRQMPPWTPGRQNGQVAKVSYTVPVNLTVK